MRFHFRSRLGAGRLGVVLVIALLVDTPLMATTVASDSEAIAVAQQDLTLKEVLEKGLRVRRPAEFAFIGRVVDMVDDGKLPLGLVQGTFNWARKKKPYPFPYFERGLKQRAAKIGIVVK